MLLLAATGAIYLYKPQIEAILYGDKCYVSAEGQRLPYEAQLALV